MNEIQELINKYWSKEISPAEQKRLFELISKKSDWLEKDLYQDYENDLSLHKGEIKEKRFQELLIKLHSRIDAKEEQPIVKTFPLYHWIKLVAALLIVVLGTVLYMNRTHTTPKVETIAKNQQLKPEILHQPFNSGKTAVNINLADGSVVTLQPGSSLSYYEPFDSRSRSISMKGEATFKVAKDKHHPFIVSAKGFTTTALGTKFTINTNKKDRVTVNLIEGKVVVKTTSKSGMEMKDVYLVPGKQLTINTRRKEQVVNDFNKMQQDDELKQHLKAPVSESMVFNEAPLNQVFDRLAKRYGVTISYEGMNDISLQKLYFTGTFNGTDKLEVVLPTICNMNDLTFKRTAKNIIISK
ncbi:FecR family protein [Agrobacterium tumefaciens]|nr:FecR family protein [Agrobacterium tumefaciens]NTE24834.1 FecR family protein [Agrobacterium tumefaciens]